MKKIIATVLAMVMALALCSTAFAANTEVTGAAVLDTNTNTYSTTDLTATFYAAKAAKLDKDGKQTNEANIAYYVLGDAKYVAVGSLAEADKVLYKTYDATKGEGSNVVLYLAETLGKYNGSGTVFTNFGDKCGQVDYDNDTSKTYYTTNEKGNENIYVADKDGTVALMVSGNLVKVSTIGKTTGDVVAHVAVPTIADGKITGYTCANCKLAAVKAPNLASVPTGITPIAGTGSDVWYFPASASSTTTNGTTSPKTFDAGIAMYVGMALTSVAGSAVVIGKKKEF